MSQWPSRPDAARLAVPELQQKVYMLRNNRWEAATMAEIAALPAGLRQQLWLLEMKRQRIVDRDLSGRDKHA
jgi:hypothetical protein